MIINEANRNKKRKRGQNEGSIRQRGPKTFEARVTIGTDENGRQKRVNVYGKSKKEVLEKMREILHQVDNKSFVAPTKLALGEWLTIWLDEYQKDSKINTITTYEQHIRVHINPILGEICLKDLDPLTIQRFYNDKWEKGRSDNNGGLSTATVKKIHTILRGALEQAVKNKYIQFNPANTVNLPKLIKSQAKAITRPEQKKFIKGLIGEHFEICLKVCLGTGLRVGELLALTWDCINWVNKTLEVKKSVSTIKSKHIVHTTKTNSSNRIIPLSNSVIMMLEKQKVIQVKEKEIAGELYDDKNLVFSTNLGNYIGKRNLLRAMYRICDKSDIPRYSLHSLRHTFASRVHDYTKSYEVVQELLGHSKSSTTMDIYIHTSEESKSTAVSDIDFFDEEPDTTE